MERIAPIFNVKGFEGTSLSDMTAAAGLTKGSTSIEADGTHPGLRKKAIAALKAWKDDLVALTQGAVMISRLTGDAMHAKAVMPAVERTFLELISEEP